MVDPGDMGGRRPSFKVPTNGSPDAAKSGESIGSKCYMFIVIDIIS
jgi:hypothetical protein